MSSGKIKGTDLTLNDPEELEKWKEERKKKFPTAARIEEKASIKPFTQETPPTGRCGAAGLHPLIPSRILANY